MRLGIRYAHGRLAVLNRDPIRAGEGAEIGVERPVLLLDHDDVPDLVHPRRHDVAASRPTRHPLHAGVAARAQAHGHRDGANEHTRCDPRPRPAEPCAWSTHHRSIENWFVVHDTSDSDPWRRRFSCADAGMRRRRERSASTPRSGVGGPVAQSRSRIPRPRGVPATTTKALRGCGRFDWWGWEWRDRRAGRGRVHRRKRRSGRDRVGGACRGCERRGSWQWSG
jgi:hypothetical protein